MTISFRSLWAKQGSGLVWLTVSVGLTFVLGLALQLVAIRQLPAGEYSTFVFALGIGNVAAAIAGAIQPVVAARAHGSMDEGSLPLEPAKMLGLALAFMLSLAAVLAPSVGFAAALLAVAQVPLHAVVSVGLGRLQGQRRYLAMAVGYGSFAVVRLGVVTMALASGMDREVSFVGALPAALAATILLLAALGAYSPGSFGKGRNASSLASAYTLWALFSWALNADAVVSRVSLVDSEAGRYALAVTLGRQSIYAVLPLTYVLLPATLSSQPESQRGRFLAILGVSFALLIGSLVVLGIAPNAVAELLTGEARTGHATVIRLYAVVGALGALVSLQLTFLFALRTAPGVKALAMAVAAASPLLLAATTAPQLAAVQLGVVFLLAVWFTWLGFAATRTA